MRRRVPFGTLIAAVLAAAGPSSGCSRVTGLPAVPASLSRADAGLAGLDEEAGKARVALDGVTNGDPASRLAALGGLIESHPDNLVLGNAFRMEVYRQKRQFLAAARARGERSPAFPHALAAEPFATLTRIAAHSKATEPLVQIGLAHVDQMILDPALEVRAPASIESVRTFTSVLADHPHDVPALVGRGLNHLNRPRKLVWPEHPASPADAASRDLALAAAVGAKVGGASPRVKGILLLLLGDAHAHEGKAGLARSWWTAAAATTDDRRVKAELAVRAGWPESEFADRLEARLEERMADMDAPVSDLSFLWNDDARGPW